MIKFTIDQALAQKIMDYLTERPYKEVALLIQGLARLERVSEPEKEEKAEEKGEDGA